MRTCNRICATCTHSHWLRWHYIGNGSSEFCAAKINGLCSVTQLWWDLKFLILLFNFGQLHALLKSAVIHSGQCHPNCHQVCVTDGQIKFLRGEKLTVTQQWAADT